MKYERAIQKALVYLKEKRRTERLALSGQPFINSSNNSVDDDDEVMVVTVVGAGRGPLVAAALTAALVTLTFHFPIYSM